jgi:hypothetical protein
MTLQHSNNNHSIDSLLDLVFSDNHHILSFPMPPVHPPNNTRFLAKLKNRASSVLINKSPKPNGDLLLSPTPVQSPVMSQPMYSTSQDFIPYTPHTRNPSSGSIRTMRSTPNLRDLSVKVLPRLPLSPESPPSYNATPDSPLYSSSSSGSTPNSPVTPVATLFTPVQTQSPAQLHSQGVTQSHPNCVSDENSKPPPPAQFEVSSGGGLQVDEPKVQIQVFPPTTAPSRPHSILINRQTNLQRLRSQPPSHPPPACPLPSPPTSLNVPAPPLPKRAHGHHPYALASLSPPPSPSARRHHHKDAALSEVSDEEDWTLDLLGIGAGTGLKRGATRSSPALKALNIEEDKEIQEEESDKRGKLRKLKPETSQSLVGVAGRDWTLSLPEAGIAIGAGLKGKTGPRRSPTSSSFSLSRAKSTPSLKPKRSISALLPVPPSPPPPSLTRPKSSASRSKPTAPTSFKAPPAQRGWARTRPGSPFPFASGGGRGSGEGDGEEVSRWIGF